MAAGADLLSEAAGLITGARAQQHGPAGRNQRNIADLLSAYLGIAVTAKQAALAMALLKIARTKTGAFNKDDYLDAVGYIALAYELALEEE